MPNGGGAAATMVHRNEWVVHDGAAMGPVFTGFQTGRTYKLSWVVNGTTGLVSYYVDEDKLIDADLGFTALSALSIATW